MFEALYWVIIAVLLGAAAYGANGLITTLMNPPTDPQMGEYNDFVDEYNRLATHWNTFNYNVANFTIRLRRRMGKQTIFTEPLLKAANTLYQNELALAPCPPFTETMEWKKYRADLPNQWERFKPDTEKLLEDHLFLSFAEFIGSLPNLEGDLFTVPLISLLTDTKPLDPLANITVTTNHHYVENAIRAKFYERNSPEHFRALLEGTFFSSLLDLQVPVGFPELSRYEGMWLVAPRGRGKTVTLAKILEDDLNYVEADEATVILMDSKGDLIDHAKKLKCFAPGGDLAGKLVLIEPSANLSINPLDLGATTGHTIAIFQYLFSGLLETQPTSKQLGLLRSVLIACTGIPGASFSTFRSILRDGWQPYEQYIRALHKDDRDFFLRGEFDSKTYTETKNELLWRIQSLTTEVPMLRDMFAAPTTKIDIGKEMDAAKVIIIDNSVAKLAAGSRFFARFFVALVLAAAQQRAGRTEKLPVYFYIDEADTVIATDENITEILNRCRSQKIGMIFAHQAMKQIKSENVLAALADCSIRMANSDEEASQLAPRLRTSPEALRSQAKGHFALFIRDYTKTALAVTVPPRPIDDDKIWPKMTETEFRAIQADMQAKYCYIPTEEPEPDRGFEEPTPGQW